VAHRIDPSRADDLPKLPALERAANVLFEGRGLAGVVAGDVTSLEELSYAHAAGLLLVARADDGEPIGFALLEIIDGDVHLEEIDVHPAHGGRGVGRALLDAVVRFARHAGHRAVTLTAFRDVPWNAPFYASAGFREVAPDELREGLAAVVRDEAARGLDPAQRVTMRLDLASDSAAG
jgi:GNAT superfamily N-acetyltransferase